MTASGCVFQVLKHLEAAKNDQEKQEATVQEIQDFCEAQHSVLDVDVPASAPLATLVPVMESILKVEEIVGSHESRLGEVP